MSNADRLKAELDGLIGLDVAALRERWRERFKCEPPAHRSPALLARAYAYELQARASDRLPRSLRRKLHDLANRFDADPDHRPTSTSSLRSGSVIVKDWNGRRYVLTACDEGYLLDGKRYASLSAAAFAITGVKWSGPRFFAESTRKL